MAVDYRQVTIANGQQISGPADLFKSTSYERYDPTPVKLYTPASFTAGDITFDVSYDEGVTYCALYKEDGSTEFKITGAAASRCYALPPSYFVGTTHMKIKTGTAQAAARVIVIALKDF